MLLLQRALPQASDLFADDRAHRPPHEGEIHHADIDWCPAQLTIEGQHGVALTSTGCRFFDPLGVFGKAEGIDRADVHLGLLRCPIVQQDRDVIGPPECGDGGRKLGHTFRLRRNFSVISV